jgi:hypothetical protein
MKYWTPLEYLTSLVVLSLLVALVAVMNWNTAARASLAPKVKVAMGLPIQAGMVIAGMALRPWVYLAYGFSCIAWSLADLWYLPLANVVDKKMVEPLGLYIKALHHRPEHAR